MRALTLSVTLVLWFCYTHTHHTEFPRALLKVLDIPEHHPFQQILSCTQELGTLKCLGALSSWTAENAVVSMSEAREKFDFLEDVKRFPWKRYSNVTDDELYSKLCDGTEGMLQYRSLKHEIPGYTFELKAGNGTLNVDIYKSDENSTARSNFKKIQKRFYTLVPFLIIPGLIMSAVLPFILPAMKMATVAVGMINNMALMGAIFTLLRNNAFNDQYDKKVVYVNAGYENNKHAPIYQGSENIETHINGLQLHELPEEHVLGDEFETIEEIPYTDWVKGYGNVGDFKVIGQKVYNRRDLEKSKPKI